MAIIELQTPLTADRTLTLHLPETVQPGDKIVVRLMPQAGDTGRPPLNLPIHHVGSWPEDLSLRREDIYGDDGR